MDIKDRYLIKILDKLINYNALPILVGGCVRDYFLHLPSKDYDIEVYGLETIEELENILEEFGDVNLVGKSFGIVKLSTSSMEYDFSFPRLENKTSQGHSGFEVIVDGNLDFKEASKRRDFTINSIGYDYKHKIFLDPFLGIEDMEKKLLKYIDKDTFIEDALRVYRAVQFSARFDFKIDSSTFNLCKKLVSTQEFKNISKERIFEEYRKLFLKSKKPSIGLTLLNELKIEQIDKSTQRLIDESIEQNITDEEKLILIFSLFNNIFTRISDDKKMYKKIEAYKSFKIPRIYRNKFKNNDAFMKQMVVKLKILKDMPKPLFMGKDLIKMGYKPSEKFKSILDTLYKMQLDGKIC